MSITRDFKLSLVAGRSVPLVINANQYDDGEIWRFTLLDENGQKYSPSTGSIIGLKSDGHIIANAGTVSSTGLVIIAETEQMTAAVGKNFYELLIDDDTHGTANFIVFVEPRPGADGTPSDSDLAVFQQAIDAAATIGDVADLVDDVAVLEARMDEFTTLTDGSTTGDAELADIRVGADGTIYPNAGDAVRGQYSDLKNAISPLFSKNLLVEQGYWAILDGKPTSSPNWCRSVSYIAKNYVFKTTTITIILEAFTQAGAYIGYWKGSEWSTSWNGAGQLTYLDINEWMQTYPSYQFKLVFYKNGSALSPSDVLSDIVIQNYNDIKTAELDEKMDFVASVSDYDDKMGVNASISNQYEVTNFVWTAGTKTLSLSLDGSLATNKTGWAVMLPKVSNAHDYVLAIEFSSTRDSASYTYIRNLTSPYNYNVGQQIAEAEVLSNGNTRVYKFTATADGWLGFGIGVTANISYTVGIKLALYDVTNSNVDGVSDEEWLQFDDVVYAVSGGVVAQIASKSDYSYNLVSNTKEEKWSALGDSLTATGSGGHYLTYVKDTLGLASYKNCGIGGTMVSGAENASAMYQDVRIESLDIDSKCVTIMGGTNDAWQSYYNEHPSTNMSGWGDVTRENHDVSTFVGAYNVMISKILYKFCKVPAYYNDVDYSGITQVATAISNFRLILLTPPQMFYYSGSPMSEAITNNGIKQTHALVKQIAELWGLPCVDTWEMGMNDMNKSLFFANYLTDSTHFNAFGHERLASLLIDKTIQVSRYK